MLILFKLCYFLDLGWEELDAAGMVHGGEGGIRTPDTLSGMPVFKTGAINHSATSPGNTVLLQSRFYGRAAQDQSACAIWALMLPLASRRWMGVRSTPWPRSRLGACTWRCGKCCRSRKLRATGTSIPWSRR